MVKNYLSSTAMAVALVIWAITVGIGAAGIGALVIWILSIFIGFITVNGYNSKIEIDEKRHKELLNATKHPEK